MALPGGPGGPPPSSGPPVIRDNPSDPGHGTPVVKPQGVQNPTPRLVEAPGTGPLPWDTPGITPPNPELGVHKPIQKPNLNLSGISAARGVIGTIRQQAKLNGVPEALALSVAMHESSFRQEAVSPSGAIGIMQLMPGTASGLNVDPYNWKQNISGGVRYLKMQYDHFHNWQLAVAAYNAGPGAVESGAWRGYSETSAYVRNVTATARQIAGGSYKPAGGSTGVITISAPLPGSPIVTSGFGPRSNPLGGGGDFHAGIDLGAPQGTPIHAMVPGTVTVAGWYGTGGNTVIIKDKTGRLWYYHHMVNTPIAKVGEQVRAGMQIGNVGATGAATGPHLHIGLQVNGKYVNPMAIINKAFKAGWNKKSTTTLSTTDFLSPGGGGVNGSGQAVAGGGGGSSPPGLFISGASGADVQVPQGVDAALVPGGQAAIPSNAAAWQRIVASGPVSPETKNLAARAGAMVSDQSPALAEVYSNPGGGG